MYFGDIKCMQVGDISHSIVDMRYQYYREDFTEGLGAELILSFVAAICLPVLDVCISDLSCLVCLF
jgi:hypothetical protein